MHKFSQMRTLDLWYTRLDVDDVASAWSPRLKPGQVKRFEQNVAKARSKTACKAFDKRAEVVTASRS